jgi:hypothetical protein
LGTRKKLFESGVSERDDCQTGNRVSGKCVPKLEFGNEKKIDYKKSIKSGFIHRVAACRPHTHPLDGMDFWKFSPKQLTIMGGKIRQKTGFYFYFPLQEVGKARQEGLSSVLLFNKRGKP